MFKIFHYDIHEYQLLQQELNQLAKNGYSTDKVSFITHFKKIDEPVYYLTDIFTSDEKSIYKKREDKQKYIDYYLENDYEYISDFKNIMVFKGNKEIKTRPFKQKIAEKEKNKRLFHFSLSLLLFFILLIFFIFPLNITDLTTNGKILFYLTLILISLTLIYRTLMKWIGIYRFSKNRSYKHINIHYLISSILPIILSLLMILSLGLDVINTKEPTSIPNHIPTLSQLGINEKTEYSIIEHSSILMPQSYEYIEYTEDQKHSIYTQSFSLSTHEKAETLLNEYINHPDKLYVDEIKKTNSNEYIGYYDNQAYLKLTIQDKTITIINTTFEIK